MENKEWYKLWKSEKYFKESDYQKELQPEFFKVTEKLQGISKKLFELLPDYSLGPEERIERLARVIPESILESKNMLTARTKLNNITMKLNYLIPDPELTEMEKIDKLVEIINLLEPGEEKLIKKLEKIDDFRRTDIGRRF